MFSDESLRLREVEISGDYEHCIVRCVVCLEEGDDILDRSSVQIFHRSYDRVLVWMISREAVRHHLLEPRAVRLVVDALATLVFHNFALVVELLLVESLGESAHAIGLEQQSEL